MNQCIFLSREHFSNQEHAFFITKQPKMMAMLYVPQKWLLEEKLSQEEKEQIIQNGWQTFRQNFPMPCICTRSGWSSYSIFIQGKKEEVINAFKYIFREWETHTSGQLFWRIALADITNIGLEWKDIITELETHGREMIEHAKSQNMFLLQLDSQGGEVLL